MKIAIYGKSFNDPLLVIFNQLYDLLCVKNNISIIVYKPLYEFIRSCGNEILNLEIFNSHLEIFDCDYFIAIGGDGTFLEAVTYVRDKQIPMAGVNIGRLGFLADISAAELNDAVTCIINQKFLVEDRSLLEIQTKKSIFGDLNFAINELTVHKKDSSSLMTIKVLINGEYLSSYWADGLIISTPTGSTAYSMSAGGPIVAPTTDNFIINAIAAHNLTVRPLIISDQSKITLQILGRTCDYLVSADSRSGVLNTGDEIEISKAKFNIKLLKLCNHSYFSTLRKKLMWGADIRN